MSITAQWTINIKNHFPKNDDKYTKFQVEFLEPDRSGKNIIWDFSNATKTGKDVDVIFKLLNDSILLKFEDRTQTIYHKKGNSLFLKSHESPLCTMKDSIPCEIMKFPLFYNKKLDSPYVFYGIYCDKNTFSTIGSTSINADACGTLILPDDTIRNVIRIHRTINTIETISNSSSKISADSTIATIRHKTDMFYWYSASFRYPLAESTIHSYFCNETEIYSQKTSFISTPLMQEQDNTAINNENKERYSRKHKSTEKTNNNETLNGIPSDITISIKDKNITINYSVTGGKTEMEITLFDIEGRIYEHIDKQTVDNGYYSHYINCSLLPIGNYILNITTNNSITNRFIPIR